MNKKKWMLIVACVVVLAAIVYALTGGKKEAPVMDYETARVEKATIGNSVTATGTIEPVTKVEVGTQVSGIIDKIYVDYNSVVHKGQIIAELDKTNLMSELNSAKSNLAGAKSDLDYQRANYKRIKALYDKELVSGNEYDTALRSVRPRVLMHSEKRLFRRRRPIWDMPSSLRRLTASSSARPWKRDRRLLQATARRRSSR